jgi:hypothetical protein
MAKKLTKGEESLKGSTSEWKHGKYRKEAEKEYGNAVSMLGSGVPRSVRKRIASPDYKEKQIRMGQRGLKETSIYGAKGGKKKANRKRVAGK